LRASEYTVLPQTTQARKAWDALAPELRGEIEDELRAHPRRNPRRPKAHGHLKAKILGKNRRCHHEYKGLPDAWRVFYTVDDTTRRVEIEYIGPHP
jgi:mRNA-degrading endonuclease RelE of RelBE toxin-antitoxin system